MDGGLAAPIPIDKSLQDGNQKHIVILNRSPEYRKKPFKFNWLARVIYYRYPGLVDALKTRYQVYNQQVEQIGGLAAEDKAFVIQPQQPLKVGRIETDQQRLTNLYQCGYQDAKEQYQKLKNWLAN